MIVLFVGTPDDGAEERFQDLGYSTAIADNATAQIGDLLCWVCASAHAVYLCPGWRASKTARAIRAAALAADVRVLGFE